MSEEDTGTSNLKTCSSCNRSLSLSCYTRDKRNKDGLCGRCIECRAHERRLAQYDLTAQEYLRMGYLQDWRCAICRTSQNELEQSLVVDHDHATSQVRGLLCNNCNLGLGHFYDHIENLQRAAQYVEIWRVTDVTGA